MHSVVFAFAGTLQQTLILALALALALSLSHTSVCSLVIPHEEKKSKISTMEVEKAAVNRHEQGPDSRELHLVATRFTGEGKAVSFIHSTPSMDEPLRHVFSRHTCHTCHNIPGSVFKTHLISSRCPRSAHTVLFHSHFRDPNMGFIH